MALSLIGDVSFVNVLANFLSAVYWSTLRSDALSTYVAFNNLVFISIFVYQCNFIFIVLFTCIIDVAIIYDSGKTSKKPARTYIQAFYNMTVFINLKPQWKRCFFLTSLEYLCFAIFTH